MGKDLSLTALPKNCRVFEWVTSKRLGTEFVQAIDAYFSLRRRKHARADEFVQGDNDYQLLVDTLEELIDDNEGILDRHCDLGRRFDWLQWLLDRCAQNDEEQLFAEQAIRGEKDFEPIAECTQGCRIKIVTPDRCELIHLWLDSLTVDQLRAQYDPIRMDRANLYKWDLRDDLEAVFVQLIAKDFEALRRFYAEVSGRGELVLVILD